MDFQYAPTGYADVDDIMKRICEAGSHDLERAELLNRAAMLMDNLAWKARISEERKAEITTATARIAELEAENQQLKDAILAWWKQCTKEGFCQEEAILRKTMIALASGKAGAFVDDDPNNIMTPENLKKHSCIEASIAFEKAQPLPDSGKNGEGPHVFDVKTSNRAMNDDEVKELYRTGKDGDA